MKAIRMIERLMTKTGARYGALLAVIALIVWGSYAVSIPVSRKIEQLATANSDNVQWTLSQVEVEYFALTFALDQDTGNAAYDAGYVRRRFDVFYSRINTLRSGTIFAPVRQDQMFETALTPVWTYLQSAIPLVDGPDEGLLAARDMLQTKLRLVRDPVRQLSLVGIRSFAEASDARRESVSSTLKLTAGIAFGLIVVLGFVALVLLRLYSEVQRRVRSNDLTTSRLRAIVSTSLAAILVVDRHGKILDFNGAAETVFGYTRAEAIGGDMGSMIIPDHFLSAHHAGMNRYLTTGEKKVIGKGRVELEAKHKSGRVFPVELSIATAQSDEGEIFVSFLRDISARVQAETDLREARDTALAGEKAKADLLAVMSHEMRTPLNGLLGMLELIQDTPITALQHKYLQNMQTSGQLLLHHVNDVLDIARLDSGKLSLAETTFELRTLLEELIDSQTRAAQANGNILEISFVGPTDVLVLGDPMRLRQILLNLVGNAIKFTRDGAIGVEVEALPEDVFEFRVTDTGIGISQSDLPRVFEDFVTLDASYGRQTGGTGLGLGITKRIVTALGGDIGVESELNDGSLFWVRVPLRRSSAPLVAAPRDAGGEKRRSKALSVLLVEDNEINRQVAHAMLATMGHTVTEAVDGQAGVAAAADRAYDLILMDISMPRMDGVEATRHIRAGSGPNAATKIIALTANALPEDVARFTTIGMDDVIIKPISRSTLRAVIDRPEDDRAPAPPGDADTLDPAVFVELLDMLGPDRVGTILTETARQVDEVVELLKNPGTQSASALADHVHKVSGAVALVGGRALHRHLKSLETSLRAGGAVPDDPGAIQSMMAVINSAAQGHLPPDGVRTDPV